MSVLHFDEALVKIHTTGVIAETVSMDSSNQLRPTYTIGRRQPLGQEPEGPQETNLQISYFFDINSDPVFRNTEFLKQLEDDKNPTKLKISVAGITGDYYLESFNIESAPNQTTKASASFISFWPLSGKLQSSNEEITGDFDFSHGWTTLVRSQDGYLQAPTYSLSYNFEANWQPTYKIGQKLPLQVNLMSANETINLTKDDYTHISFSGEDPCDNLFSCGSDQIEFIGVSIACDSGILDNLDKGINQHFPSIDLTGSKITESNLSIEVDDFARNQLILRNFY